MGREVKAILDVGFNLWLYLVRTFLRQFPDHSNTNLRWSEKVRSNDKVFRMVCEWWWGGMVCVKNNCQFFQKCDLDLELETSQGRIKAK